MEYKYKISVIVPVYNIEKYIERCLRSIIAQEFSKMEIIVVNDGSTDNSGGIINEIAKTDTRIVLLNKPNGGLSSARNAGIGIAQGEYLMHIDGDDWIEGDYLLDAYNFAEQNKHDIVITDTVLEQLDEKLVIKNDINFMGLEYVDGHNCANLFLEQDGDNSVCNKIIKKSLYKDNEIWHPENISNGEDLATILRLMYCAKSVGRINHGYYHYVRRRSSISGNQNAKNLKDILQAFEILERFFSCSNLTKQLSIFQARHLAKHYIFNLDIAANNSELCGIIKKYLYLNCMHKVNYKSRNLNLCSQLLQQFPHEQLIFALRWAMRMLKNRKR